MDLTAVLAYKSLFFANRAKNAMNQASEGKSCTSAANATRCAITASQALVPLFAVSKTLAATTASPSVRNAAAKISNSNLQKIAMAMTSPTTQSALSGIAKITSFLAKLGIVGNISYAVAKCMDAKAEDKTQVFMQAAGNCAGMYLFEYIYKNAVKNIKPDVINSGTKTLTSILPAKIPCLGSLKPVSIVLGVGFVVASLLGCWAGEKFGDSLCRKPQPLQFQPQPVYVGNNQNINMIA